MNCDYYPVAIDVMPTVNGQQLTKEQFLGCFRSNMNTFFERPNPVFTPYNSLGVNDASLWNSSDPTSSILVVDLIPGIESGAVIVSKFESTNFTVSTLYTPKTLEHPLSGNRQWGVFNPSSNPNQTYFYTQGVDRIRSWLTELINDATGTGWKGADDLWQGMQRKVVDFINSHGGVASIPGTVVPSPKPKWDELKEVISGKITIEQFKQKIGCP